jgi:DNA-3-methyladenine glycosylase I
MITKCAWAIKHKIEEDYHDSEWGVPVYNDRLLFECLILESAQAGLSWYTVLKKRDNYRIAFDNFDILKVANYNQSKVDELLMNEGIIRHKLKINATINNAKIFLEIQNEYGSFSNYIWSFTNGKPIQNNWKSSKEVPAKTELSDAMSKALKKKGFKFIGTTICYAYMQAIGMVNDHTTSCFRHNHIKNI